MWMRIFLYSHKTMSKLHFPKNPPTKQQKTINISYKTELGV